MKSASERPHTSDAGPRRLQWATLVLFLLHMTMCGSMVLATPPGTLPADQGPAIGNFLTPERHLDLEALRNSNYQGPLDIAGYNLQPGSAAGGLTFMKGPASDGWSPLDTDDYHWQAGFDAPGMAVRGGSLEVAAMILYGGDLIVAGTFTHIGGMEVNHIARWDGSSWYTLGTGLSGAAWTLAVYDGSLIVGGGMYAAGGIPVSNIARWDGSAWAGLGSGTNSRVEALTVHDGSLFVGGVFTTAGGVPANYIARWDGSQWHPLGTGTNGWVSALASYDGGLIAGGVFLQAGGSVVNYIARWDGSTWSALGTGMDQRVMSLAVFGQELVAAGGFSQAGGAPALSVARWNGTAWNPLGQGTVGEAWSLAVWGEDLIVGGRFTRAGGAPASRSARWDGVTWSPIGSGMNDYVRALCAFEGGLMAGGWFAVAGGVPAVAIARWDGVEWTAMHPGAGLSSDVLAIATLGADLIVGGNFVVPNDPQTSFNGIARWNGSSWQPLGAGLNNTVVALGSYGGSLVAGGSFTRTGDDGTVVNFVARWDGSAWYPLGTGLNSTVYALEEYSGNLIAAGTFTQAGGAPASLIARWDGSSWSALGSGLGGLSVYALTVYNGDLIVGGSFVAAGGGAANYVARWNGTSWNALGPGMNGTVRSLTVHGTDLIAGGEFTTAGGSPANCVARWNGTSWSALGAGTNSWINVLLSAGDRLFAGGTFTTAGGGAAKFAAQWNGSTWSTLGSGLDHYVFGMKILDERLWVGGTFATAGGKGSSKVACWTGLVGPCSVIVTEPALDDTFCIAQPDTIRWEHGGDAGDWVKIELLQNGEVLGMISPSTENDGLFEWTPAVEGGNFKIRVTDLFCGLANESEGTFSILPPCLPEIAHPNGGEVLVEGAVDTLRWYPSGCCGSSVRIELVRQASPCLVIAASTPNTGTYLWPVIRCGQALDGYRVRLTDLETGVVDESDGDFQIVSLAASGAKIVVTEAQNTYDCDMQFEYLNLFTFYIYAVYDPSVFGCGITGAMFKVNGLNSYWVVSATPNPQANTVLGNPLADGCAIAFPDCQPPLHGGENYVLLYTVTGFSLWQGTGAVSLTVSPGIYASGCAETGAPPLGPVVIECDAPTYTNHCAQGLGLWIRSATLPPQSCDPTPPIIPVQEAIAVDGVNDFEALNRVEIDTGDTQYSQLDLRDLYVTNDAQKLYFGFGHDKGAWTAVQTGIMISTVAKNGATSDAWGHRIVWGGPHKPGYAIYKNYDTNWQELREWTGAAWSEPLLAGPGAVGMSNGTAFQELGLPLAQLGLAPGDSLWFEVVITQDGSKGPLDLSKNDAVQLSTSAGTVWEPPLPGPTVPLAWGYRVQPRTSIGIYFDPLYTRSTIVDPIMGYPFKAWLVVKGMPELSAWDAGIIFPPIVFPPTLVVLNATLLPSGSVNQGSSPSNWIVDLPECTGTGPSQALAVVEYNLQLNTWCAGDPCPSNCAIEVGPASPSQSCFAKPSWGDCDAARFDFTTTTPGVLGGCQTSGQTPQFVSGPSAHPVGNWSPTVQFQAAAWDDDTPQSQLQYYWFFDDGGFATGQSPQHTYAEPGSYLVWVNVTDGVNDRSATLPVTVSELSDGGGSQPIPTALKLYAVQPNPFVQTAQLRFDVPQAGLVKLDIYSVSGRLVRELAPGWRNPGTYTTSWDGLDATGSRVAAGVYVARLRSLGKSETVRLVLLR